MEKPYHPRTSASVDSQSVDTTSGGEQRGRDNFKNVDGRKRGIRGRQPGPAAGRPGHGHDMDDAGRQPNCSPNWTAKPWARSVWMYADGDCRDFKLQRTGGKRAVGAVHRAASRGV